jgi:hypothetical protein
MSTPYSITGWSWGDGVTVNGAALRGLNASMFNKLGVTSPLSARGGVLDGPAEPCKITAYSGMTLAVAPGSVVVPGAAVADGVYTGHVAAGATFILTAADPSQARIDRIVVKVDDIGTSGSSMKVIPVDGTPGAGVAPAEPSDCITLATVAVAAGAVSISNANITDMRTFTVAAGGIVPVASSAAFPADGPKYAYFHNMADSNLWTRIGGTNYPLAGTYKCTSSTRPTDKIAGTIIFETDTKTLYTWDGTNWKLLIDVGAKTYTPAWTNSGGAPVNAIGNGTLTGEYERIGDWIEVTIKMTGGTTTFAGTGTQYWSLPVAPVTSPIDSSINFGSFVLSDAGGSSRAGAVQYATGSKVSCLYQYYSSGQIILDVITSVAPITWNTNDVIVIKCKYRWA